MAANFRSDEAGSAIVDWVGFSFYTSEQIRKMSVKKISVPECLNIKGAPVIGGLYDPAMGPINDNESCKICGQLSSSCQGHCGHIDLATEIFNPLLFPTLLTLIQNMCFSCHMFKRKKEKVHAYIAQLKLILKGDIVSARRMSDNVTGTDVVIDPDDEYNDEDEDANYNQVNFEQHTWTSAQHREARSILIKFKAERIKKCQNCLRDNPKISSPELGTINILFKDAMMRANVISGQPMNEMSSGQLLPSTVKGHLSKLWKNEPQMCSFLCDIQQKRLDFSLGGKGYMIFFMEVLLVPPNQFRPASMNSDGREGA
ncbi:DNA-directed RNA polymerase [Zostera marina]|uniref:DNA-directed RNA polymerase n=1 Tax=Zostera marina TaxID=29655 RepID=A0A0K9PAY0_ZOSMR|nr:DNA-directed RNA polymerase [Zostera marina]